MRKLVIFGVATLLIASNVMASDKNLDSKGLADTILNMHNIKSSDKGSAAMIYGGEDISHDEVSEYNKFTDAALVG